MKNPLRNFQWKHYLVSSIIVSIGAFIIHSQNYRPPELDRFFMWLPAVWVMVFVMACLFGWFIGEGD